VNEPTETADEARERLRAMAFDLATSGGLVEPRAFDAALDAYRDALLAAATPAGPAPAAERAAVLLEAADCAYRIARRLDDQHHDQRAQGAWDVENVLRAELRRMAGEAQQDGCGPACSEQHTYGDHCEAQQDPTQDGEERETDEQRADREETERDHAAGDHTYCGQTCEVEFPSEQLRNFVIAKGYPGTKGALDELLRRAAVARPGQPETEA
jgi:hypothetical protein